MMSEQEVDKCNTCMITSMVSRQYYNYDIHCDCCCGSQHFEIVRYCKKCDPSPPQIVTIKLRIQPNE